MIDVTRTVRTAAAAIALLAFAGAAEARGLIDADRVAERIGEDDFVVLDIRPSVDRDTGRTVADAHIPGSVHAPYGEFGWRAQIDGIIGMAPAADDLERLIGRLGIDNDDSVVVVFDGKGASPFGSAARVYWTFRYLGHDDVFILDGGFRAWTGDASRPVADTLAAPEPARFTAELQDELLVTSDEVQASLGDPRVVRIDARPQGQYRGEAQHPAAGAAGRIPGAVGLDQALWFEGDGRLKPRSELEAYVPEPVKTGEADLVISYCNTGHWAATNWFVLSEALGYGDVRLYDGSMVAWTFDPSRPLETGRSLWDSVSRWVSG